jgi:hypothetical protein
VFPTLDVAHGCARESATPCALHLGSLPMLPPIVCFMLELSPSALHCPL